MTGGLAGFALFMWFVLLAWVAPIYVGNRIGVRKRRAGWAWGLLLSWLGVLILAVLPSRAVND